MKFTLLISAAMVLATATGYCQVAVGHFSGVAPYEAPVPGPSLSQQQAADIQLQQRQALMAAQKAAAEKAAWESFQAAKMEEIARDRDAALAVLHDRLDPDIIKLEAEMLPLQLMVKDLEALRSESATLNDARQAWQMFQPKDPWRLIDGKVGYAKDANWCQFTGTVLSVRPNGILIQGDFGPPTAPGFGKRRYFVENFPNDKYALADDEKITATMNFVARLGGKTTYQFTSSTIQSGVETVRRLDYGQVVDNPPPDLVAKSQNHVPIMGGADPDILRQIAENDEKLVEIKSKLTPAQSELDLQAGKINATYDEKLQDLPNLYAQYLRDKANERKAMLQDKVLKSNQDSADRGDVYGLLRMGERYRDGEGVEKDLTKAREYLNKAANAGSPTAADDLKKLN